MPAHSARSSTLALVARCLFEGITFASLAAIAHGALVPKAPLWLFPSVLAVAGVTYGIAVVVRDQIDASRSRTITAIVVVAAAAWGLSMPAVPQDGLATLTRIVVFGLVGEAYLWRVVTLARDRTGWDATLGGIALAALLLGLDAVMPLPIDRRQLPVLGLLLAFTGASALSLSRSNEELALAGREARGVVSAAPSRLTAVVVGAASVLVAAKLPDLEAALQRLADATGPPLLAVLYVLLLPLGYLAELLDPFFEALRRFIYARPLTPPRSPLGESPEDMLARMRALEETRPFIFGAVELVIALVGLVIAIIIVERLIGERMAKSRTTDGLERESVEGIGVRAMLAQLLPKRTTGKRPPADDGSAAARVRIAYWRFLELCERAGSGWRADAETPRAHWQRQAATGGVWSAAGPLISVFENVRYGEREPDPDEVAAAEGALAAVRAGTAR